MSSLAEEISSKLSESLAHLRSQGLMRTEPAEHSGIATGSSSRDTAKSSLNEFIDSGVSELQIGQLAEYVELLKRWTKVVDLVSQESGESMVIPHIVDSVAAFVVTRPTERRYADIGSGAGLPGIVWSILQPEKQIVLLEPRKRRVDFLREVRRILGLKNIELRASRMDQVEAELFPAFPGLASNAPSLVACRALGIETEYLQFAREKCGPGSRAVILAGPSFSVDRMNSVETPSVRSPKIRGARTKSGETEKSEPEKTSAGETNSGETSAQRPSAENGLPNTRDDSGSSSGSGEAIVPEVLDYELFADGPRRKLITWRW